jgi:LmbE family N-acetylglucosaminyl deacetylase
MSSPDQLELRLARCGRTRLCIISPHLDDAAFSVVAALQATGFEHKSVVTVVTEAGPDGGTRWARSAGFDGPEAEFRARQDEDRRALGSMGATARHLGVTTGGTRELIDTALRTFLGTEAHLVDQTLYLLPGGAGRAQLRSGPWRIINRILRHPPGAAAHPEHIAVRDALTRRLSTIAEACFGYYGEQPYVWNDSTPRLREELERLSGLRLEAVRVKPAMAAKLDLARRYESQFPLIFGTNAGFQQRALGRAEEYFLVS